MPSPRNLILQCLVLKVIYFILICERKSCVVYTDTFWCAFSWA